MTVVMEKRSRAVGPARCRLEGWLSRRLDPVPASGRPLLSVLSRASFGDRYVISISHDKRTAYKWIKLPFPGLFPGLRIK